MKYSILFFLLLTGCAAPEFGCHINKHDVPTDSCYFCQYNNSFWDVGCIEKQHMSYSGNCEFCLVKAQMWRENKAEIAARDRAKWATVFAQRGQHSGYEQGRRDPWISVLDGFCEGMAIGLGG